MWANEGYVSENGWYRPKPASAPPATTTWNPLDKGPDVVLTNGNLTATSNTSGGGQSVRANSTGRLTGKYHYSAVVTVNSTFTLIGMANASKSLTTFLGSDTDGLGWDKTGTVYINNAQVANIQTWAVGDTLSMEVNLDASPPRAFFKTNTGDWNNDPSADPASNVGGIDISGMAAGPYFPAAQLWSDTESLTANFGGSAYSPAATLGFGNW